MKPYIAPPNTLVVHCTATPNGVPFTVKQIRAMHVAPKPKGRGFSDIGYHWVILLDGTQAPGRPEMFVGAHVENENSHCLGVSLVGTDKFTKEQWQGLASKITDILARYPSITHTCGHRDFSPDLNHNGTIERNEWIKICPSFDVAKWIANGMKPIPEQTIQLA